MPNQDLLSEGQADKSKESLTKSAEIYMGIIFQQSVDGV
jgi:hypothetical protein